MICCSRCGDSNVADQNQDWPKKAWCSGKEESLVDAKPGTPAALAREAEGLDSNRSRDPFSHSKKSIIILENSKPARRSPYRGPPKWVSFPCLRGRGDREKKEKFPQLEVGEKHINFLFIKKNKMLHILERFISTYLLI